MVESLLSYALTSPNGFGNYLGWGLCVWLWKYSKNSFKSIFAGPAKKQPVKIVSEKNVILASGLSGVYCSLEPGSFSWNLHMCSRTTSNDLLVAGASSARWWLISFTHASLTLIGQGRAPFKHSLSCLFTVSANLLLEHQEIFNELEGCWWVQAGF